MNKSSKPIISIIYVNYNTHDLLIDSLKSLIKNIGSIDYEVIVIDNNSKQFDESSIKELSKDVTIIRSHTNLGFGGGNNAAALKAKGEYLWLLNTDTLVPKDNHINLVIKYLEENDSYAAASPLLVNEKGVYQSSQIAYFPSVVRMVLEKPTNFITKLIPSTKRMFRSINADNLGVAERDIESAAAASFVVRRSVFEEVGGFSKQYFMYYEDTDLCKKIAVAGYKIRFLPQSKIIHLLGQSISSSFERKKLYFESQDIYFLQWKSRPARLSVHILRIPLVAIYWLKDKLA